MTDGSPAICKAALGERIAELYSLARVPAASDVEACLSNVSLLERIYLPYDEQNNRMHFYANYGIACEYTEETDGSPAICKAALGERIAELYSLARVPAASDVEACLCLGIIAKCYNSMW